MKEECLLCCAYRQKIHPSLQEEDDTDKVCGDKIEIESALPRHIRSRGGSINESSGATPNSVSSATSAGDPPGFGDKRLSEDSEAGRQLIHLEVMRLIVNLGSSLGLRSYEDGLLSLKQKFPKCFQNICFYSEVCHLLSSYSYRLNARRFIQDLFDELDCSTLMQGPHQTFGVVETAADATSPFRQDSIDEFQDFSFA